MDLKALERDFQRHNRAANMAVLESMDAYDAFHQLPADAPADVRTAHLAAMSSLKVIEKQKDAVRWTAHHALQDAQLALAQATIVTEYPRAKLITELDTMIATRRVADGITFGASIVAWLESSQRSGGFREHCLAELRVPVRNMHEAGAKPYDAKLTPCQQERAWRVLTATCVVRPDGGLAPPYRLAR